MIDINNVDVIPLFVVDQLIEVHIPYLDNWSTNRKSQLNNFWLRILFILSL